MTLRKCRTHRAMFPPEHFRTDHRGYSRCRETEKLQRAKFEQTPAAAKRYKRYQRTERGKARQFTYNLTEAGRGRFTRYEISEKGSARGFTYRLRRRDQSQD